MRRRRYLAEVVRLAERPHALDAFAPDAPPVPLAEGVDAEVGAYREVRVRDDGSCADPLGEVFAPPGSPAVELVRLALAEALDPAFPAPVEAEVAALFRGAGDVPPGTDDPELTDRTALAFVTIDNEDSRDLDQALHLEHRAGGGFVARYALSDAAYYVRPGTALHREALARGASYYLPGWMIPMLPRELCEGLVSLNPGVLRRALLFEMHLDAEGRPLETRAERARIRSRAKLSYPGVQRFLDARDARRPHPYDDEPFAESLLLLRAFGLARLEDARERAVVRPRRQEVEVGLTRGRSFSVLGGIRRPVEAYNEQLSLLCNVEGARLLQEGRCDARVQAIFRVHPAPDEARVAGFERFVARLVRSWRLPEERWAWSRQGPRTLAAYLAELPQQGPEGRLARAIHRQAVLLNVRSTFDEAPAPHYGVGSEVYARFSAPMREMVGVFLHKELCELLGLAEARTLAEDEALRESVLQIANEARARQSHLARRAHHLALDALFRADLRAGAPVRPATVMGVTRSKVHVTLDEPPVDVKLYRSELEPHLGQRLRLGEDRVALVDEAGAPVVRVGGRLDVRVARHDDARQRWILLPA